MKIDAAKKQKVMEFDKMVYSYESMMAGIVMWTMSVIGMLIMLLPVEAIFFSGLVIIGISVLFHIIPYTTVKNRNSKNQQGIMQEIIKYAPIEKNVLISVRLGYVVKHYAKLTVAFVIIKLLICLASQTFDWKGLLIGIAMVFVYPVTIAILELTYRIR